ncbi:hypothetical protein BJ508DRAFT_85562 [Ascobolus immersus RN42]|uniref:Uncharacterized protein n=1 Tax=Ascobolus immersus RN42 TaxID=1160509 RepID=A0A3N4HIF0_ASCIM|nr:hypothetical protein BJ508DRAFT_85562 [Ascobolus immersus RN42]
MSTQARTPSFLRYLLVDWLIPSLLVGLPTLMVYMALIRTIFMLVGLSNPRYELVDPETAAKNCEGRKISGNADISGIGVIIGFTLTATSSYIATIWRWWIRRKYKRTIRSLAQGDADVRSILFDCERQARKLDRFILSMCDANFLAVLVLIICTILSLSRLSLFHVIVSTELIQFTVTVTFTAATSAYAFNQSSFTREERRDVVGNFYDCLFVTSAVLGPFFTYGIDGMWLAATNPETRSSCFYRGDHIFRFFAIPILQARTTKGHGLFLTVPKESKISFRIIYWFLLDCLPCTVAPLLAVLFNTFYRHELFHRLIASFAVRTKLYEVAKCSLEYSEAASEFATQADGFTSTFVVMFSKFHTFPLFTSYLFFYEVLMFLALTWIPNQKYTEDPSEHSEWGFGQIYALLAAVLTISVSIFHAWADEVEIDYLKIDANGKEQAHYLSSKNYWNRSISQRIVDVVEKYNTPLEPGSGQGTETTIDVELENGGEDTDTVVPLRHRIRRRQTWSAFPPFESPVETTRPSSSQTAARTGLRMTRSLSV